MTNTRAANEALNPDNASLEVQVKPLSEVSTPTILDMCCGSRMF